MLIHLVEPLASGHRLVFVRRIATAARSAGHQVLLSTSAATRAHPAFAEVDSLVETLVMPDSDSHVARLATARGFRARIAWHRWFAAYWRTLSRAQRGDVVVLPYSDYCLLACGLLGSPFADQPWVGITMQPNFHHPDVGIDAPAARGAGVSKWLFGRALHGRTLRRLFALDETLPTWADARWPGLAGRCVHLGDPAEPLRACGREDARRHFSLPSSGRVLLVFGAINPRKGLGELAAAMAQPVWPADVVALVLGSWDAATQAQADDPVLVAARASGRMVVHSRWANDVDEAAAFAAADVVWLGYRDFFQSSGVLMQAAQAGLPVVACQAGLIGWLTAQHELGAVVDPRDPVAVATAVRDAQRGPAAAHYRPVTGEQMGQRVVSACAGKLP